MSIKKTHRDRQQLLDRLEKKYIKKIQIQAFQRETEKVNRALSLLRGSDRDSALRLQYL